MISARGPDPASADELGIDVRAPCFASLARLPDRSTPCRPASAEASNRAVGPAFQRVFIGMTKPTIQQARDRAEVVSGATRPEWVTSAGSLERANGRGLANVCKVRSADRALARRTSGTGRFQPLGCQ